jgi:hypothetical protein
MDYVVTAAVVEKRISCRAITTAHPVSRHTVLSVPAAINVLIVTLANPEEMQDARVMVRKKELENI